MTQSLVLQQRPGSVLAAAILAIIYGCLFTLCGLIGVGALAGQGAMNQAFAGGDPQQAQMQKQMEEALERDVPGYRVFQIAGPIVGLAESLVLLIAGIGLLGMHSWARKLAVAAALIAVASTTFQAVYQVVFIVPATSNAIGAALPAAMPKGPAGPGPGAPAVAKMMQVMFTVVGFVTVVFCVLVIAYLLVIVFLLQRRHVRAAFAGWGVQPEIEERPDREVEDEPRRPSAPPRNAEDDFRYR